MSPMNGRDTFWDDSARYLEEPGGPSRVRHAVDACWHADRASA